MKPTRKQGAPAKGLLLFCVIFSTLTLVSCASGPPEILGVEWTLESKPNPRTEDRQDDLSVFVRVHDSDGLDDIEAMWIIDDSAELSWSLGPSSWTRKSLGSDECLGASGLSMPDGEPLPPGRYRVVVADLAGNRASYDFTIAKVDDAERLPIPEWKGGRVGLVKAWPENYLLAYDAAGSLLRSAVLPASGASLASLVGTEDAKRTQAFAVYCYDPASRRGVFSKRILFR